jgi:hypothetical protein
MTLPGVRFLRTAAARAVATARPELAPPTNLASHPMRFLEREHAERWAKWQRVLTRAGWAVKITAANDNPTKNATRLLAAHLKVGYAGTVTPGLWTAALTAKPGSGVGPGTLPALLGRPRILDCRPGRGGFPNGPGDWGHRGLAQIKGWCGHYTGGQGSFLGDAIFHTTSDYLTDGGAPALAYHAGSDKDGTLRVFNPITRITWHCDGGQNTDWIGLVFIGASEGPSVAQDKTMAYLTARLKDGRDATLNALLEIPGGGLGARQATTHQHVKATSCPGNPGEALYRRLAAEQGLRFADNP